MIWRYVDLGLLWPLMAVAALGLTIAWFATRRRRSARARAMPLVLLATTVVGILILTLGPVGATPFGPSGAWNLVPLRTISYATSTGSGGVVLLQIVGNVVMFVPLGLLLWLMTRKVVLTLLAAAALSLLIETAQLGIGRSSDVDDVILNVFGTLLGVFLARGVRTVFLGMERRPIGRT
ncbi:MAG TPA: VanZ family protein [Actinomycetales bacterium]|nr:VanZ family protein [Actinomycetales bacterium]